MNKAHPVQNLPHVSQCSHQTQILTMVARIEHAESRLFRVRPDWSGSCTTELTVCIKLLEQRAEKVSLRVNRAWLRHTVNGEGYFRQFKLAVYDSERLYYELRHTPGGILTLPSEIKSNPPRRIYNNLPWIRDQFVTLLQQLVKPTKLLKLEGVDSGWWNESTPRRKSPFFQCEAIPSDSELREVHSKLDYDSLAKLCAALRLELDRIPEPWRSKIVSILI